MKVVNCQTYSVYIGNDSLKSIDLSEYSSVAIVVDEHTKSYCLNTFLEESNIQSPLIIETKSGEENKTITSCQLIWDALTEAKFDRKSILINLGGGVIGDMGGFAASCYKRGINFIQVPTTLLAMVDASVGGKLGVDYSNLKNQIGLFRNPQGVFIYPSFLKTLSKEQLYSGYAEVVKHALIYDAKMWKSLHSTDVEKLNWEDIITKSVTIKNEIVSNDPHENGYRKILNFGHSIGHAIESYCLSIGKVALHGQAVATGMLLESQLSNATKEEKIEISNFLKSTFDLIELPDFEDILPFLKNDKKNKNKELKFSLISEIGKCSYDCTIDVPKIKALF